MHPHRHARWFVMGAVLLAVSMHALAGEAAQGFRPVKTGLVRGGDKPRAIRANVTGLQDLYLVVTYGGDHYWTDQAIWAAPTLVAADGRRVDLTTLEPVRAQVGWGRLYVNTTQRGTPLTIPGKTYAKGFWAHGPSVLHFRLGGKYVRFEAEVGLDVGAGREGSVEFLVTHVPPKMPTEAAYKKPRGPAAPQGPPLVAPPAAESAHTFNAEAAKVLLAHGIEKLVFVRRFTLTANHVYTEYVNSRWLPGGGLCVLDLATGTVTDLVPETRQGVVNRFDISYDADRIAFDYKSASDQGYRLYEVGADGSGLRQLTFPTPDEKDLVRLYAVSGYHHGTDDLHPCYLPDGDIVFVSTRCRSGVLCDSGDRFTTKVLYRMGADGGNLRRLSNNCVSEASPVMMRDGRILYHRWEYNDKGAGAVKCLWAVRPDGTASVEVYGNMITDPETMIYGRPIPGADRKLVFLGASHWGPNNAMGTVIVLDPNADPRSREAMRHVTPDVDARAHAGFHFLVDGKYVHSKSGKEGRLFKDPYPVTEDLFIVAQKPKGPAWNDPKAYGLYLLDGAGRTTLLYGDDAISCWHPYPLRPRPRPPEAEMPTRPDLAAKGLAHCVVTDITEGLDGVEPGTVKYIRILEQTPRPWTARTTWPGDRHALAHSALGYGILGLKAQHGIVPVEADGSASFLVPADRNIYFQVLDENFLAIQTERTYVNYRPGETRSCMGCHKRTTRSPRVRGQSAGLALRREPLHPVAQPGDDAPQQLFDYERQIQPIWNAHCIRCHNGAEQAKANLDLTGTRTTLYSASYENLMGREADKKRRSRLPLVGVQVDENSVRAFVPYAPPYAFGAYTSVLAAVFGRFEPRFEPFGGSAEAMAARVEVLRKQHKDVRLSREEFIRIVNWLDASCQYYGSYWGMKNLQHRESPYFRPQVSFAEAISVRWPAGMEALYKR